MKKHPKAPNLDDEDDAPILTPEMAAKGRVTSFPVPPGTTYVRSEKDGLVTLTAKRGGARPGAGRKLFTGKVRMWVSVPPAVKSRIEARANREGKTVADLLTEKSASARLTFNGRQKGRTPRPL